MPLKARRIDSKLESLPKAKAAFIEPMLLLRAGALPETADWLYELKLDGSDEIFLSGLAFPVELGAPDRMREDWGPLGRNVVGA